MILTVLVVSVAFGTETKFQVRIILLRTSADSTFMLGNRIAVSGERHCFTSAVHCALELILSVDFLGIVTIEIPGSQEKDHKIQQ